MASKQSFVGTHIMRVLWAAALLQLIIECSCMPIIPITVKTQPVPMVCGTPAAPSSSSEIVQLGLDGLPLYQDRYFHAVLSATADRIMQHITIGSNPMVVFINYITHDSLNQNIMSIAVPGVPQLPNKPVLQTSPDPYKAATLRKDYQTALACWQKEGDGLQQVLRLVKAQVRVETDKMYKLSYPYDPVADDIDVFLYDAASHLASYSSVRKFMYIGSPLLDNTNVNVVGNYNFSGVAVSVLDFSGCSPASVCIAVQTKFTKLFRRWGSISINWYLPGAPESSELAF